MRSKVVRPGTVLIAKQPGTIIRTAVGTLLPITMLGKQVGRSETGCQRDLWDKTEPCCDLFFLMMPSNALLRLH